MVTVVFLHFLAGAATYAVRAWTQPVCRCIACFFSSLQCLFSCCGLCRRLAREGSRLRQRSANFVAARRTWGEVSKRPAVAAVGGDVVEAKKPSNFGSRFTLRWYWLHLAMQVAFMVRECMVISVLDGWKHPQVIIAQVAMWLTIAIVTYEVWMYSKVRNVENARETIDAVLDMLLLPVNIGFFCEVCVRILTLQPESKGRGMISAVIEAADIWEALALKSVLVLFIKVVDTQSQHDSRATSGYFEAIHAFKSLSLQGVTTWVMILTGLCSFNILLKGLVAVYVPTLCHYRPEWLGLKGTCESCAEWYEHNVHIASVCVNFILCSFALVFVFSFEHLFSDYLRGIDPFWKFWGVKGVVSVTFFQWIVFSYCFKLSETEVYLLHCLACVAEMPVLAAVHATCAYPFGKPWLYSLLSICESSRMERTLSAMGTPELELQDVSFSAAGSSQPPRPAAPARPAATPLVDAAAPIGPSTSTAQEAQSTSQRAVAASSSLRNDAEVTRTTSRSPRHPRSVSFCQPASEDNAAGATPSFVGEDGMRQFSGQDDDGDSQGDAHGWNRPSVSSSTGDGERRQSHTSDRAQSIIAQSAMFLTTAMAERSSVEESWYSFIGYVITWLIFCSAQVRFICWLSPPSDEVEEIEPVYIFTCSRQDLPRFVTEHKHELHFELLENTTDLWRLPNVAGSWLPLCAATPLACSPGYIGQPTLRCTARGEYAWDSGCQAMSCGEPPSVSNASPMRSSRSSWTVRDIVKYKCHHGYRGEVEAVCEDDGHFVVKGSCDEILCGPPPAISHAQLSDAIVKHNVRAGTVLSYQCIPPFWGTPSAYCNYDGDYEIQGGSCRVACGRPPQLPDAFPTLDISNPRDKWFQGAVVAYACNDGFSPAGPLEATCGSDGAWSVSGSCHKQCRDLKGYLHKQIGADWRNVVDIKTNKWNVADSGDMISLNCSRGLEGHPYVTCVDGSWRLSGRPCALVPTTSGCSCKREWILCTGWLGSDCEIWYGCYAKWGLGHCEVEPGSCRPPRHEPATDNCIASTTGATWEREPVQGPDVVQKFVVSLTVLLALVVFCACLLQFLRRRQAAKASDELPGPGHGHGHSPGPCPAVAAEQARA